MTKQCNFIQTRDGNVVLAKPEERLPKPKTGQMNVWLPVQWIDEIRQLRPEPAGASHFVIELVAKALNKEQKQ